MSPTADFINRTIHYVPGTGLVYLNNPKVACSSMKKSMWLMGDRFKGTTTFTGNPHNRLYSPFCKNLRELAPHLDDFLSATFFTVVRNPYVRLLSAYLDKVAKKPRDAAVWRNLAGKLRYTQHERPCFSEFLSRVVECDPWEMDRHFAPQRVNILLGYITPDFVGHIEDMDGVLEFFSRHDLPLERHTPHRTNAAESVAAFYGRAELQMACSYYAEDFEMFGYSNDPRDLAPVKACSIQRVDRSALCNLVTQAGGQGALDLPSSGLPSNATERPLHER
jgi:hypothetical protein